MEFKVNISQLKSASAGVQNVRAALLKTNADLDGVADMLYRQDSSYEVIVSRLRKYQGSLTTLSYTAGRFGETASAIASKYQATETGICAYPVINLIKSLLDALNKAFHTKRKKKGYEVSSIVFDDKGSYGGHQGSANNEDSEARKQALFDLIRRNNPDANLSDEQLNNFLAKMSSEGCGYVALINTIFVAYEGREDEFEKAFGYPMYYKSDLNYDMLLADLYSTMDNRDANGNYDAFHDYVWYKDGLSIFYDPWKDTSGYGSTPEERAYYIQEFMKDHGGSVKVNTDVNVTPGNFRSISESGKQVIVSLHYGDVLNMDGSVKQYIDGGHAMVVTGVTDNGMLIVSSWGKKYMIDPNGTYVKTSLSYSTVEYK